MGIQNRDTTIEYDRESHCYRIRHDWWDDQPLSAAVVEAVAAVTNTPMTDIDPLYEVVDPDALNQLYEPTSDGPQGNDGYATFTFHGCEITVFATGDIELYPPDDA